MSYKKLFVHSIKMLLNNLFILKIGFPKLIQKNRLRQRFCPSKRMDFESFRKVGIFLLKKNSYESTSFY
jgi:hypothetical protein